MSPKQPSNLPKELSLALTKPDQLVLWVGAGISYDSGVPIGDTFTRAVLKFIFDRASRSGSDFRNIPSRIESIYRTIFLDGTRTVPRLEFVLDRMRHVLGESVYKKCFALFGAAKPNVAHYALGALAQRGARIITANFDTLLTDGYAPDSHIIHYHGRWSEPETCGATLSQIAWESPRWEQISLKLRQVLSGATTVLFIGYSGRDFYDINRFMSGCRRQFHSGLWLCHKHDQSTIKRLNRPKLGKGNASDKSLSHLAPLSASFLRFRIYEGLPYGIYNECIALGYMGETLAPAASSSFEWEKYLGHAFDGISDVKLWTLILDLTSRMGLDEIALTLIDSIERRIACLPEKKNPQMDNHELIDLKLTVIDTLYLASRYTSVMRRLKTLPSAGYVGMSARRALIRRRYAAGSSGFGFFLGTLIQTTWRAIAALKHFEDHLNEIEHERDPVVLSDRLWALHSELHVFFQIVNAIPAGIPRSTQTKMLADIRDCERRMQVLYVSILKSNPSTKYDEYLAQILQGGADVGDQSLSKHQKLEERWKETDNLRHTLVSRRHTLRSKASRGEIAATTKDDIRRGIVQAQMIGCSFELLCWIAHAERYDGGNQEEWERIRKEAFVRIETGFPSNFTKRLIWMLIRRTA